MTTDELSTTLKLAWSTVSMSLLTSRLPASDSAYNLAQRAPDGNKSKQAPILPTAVRHVVQHQCQDVCTIDRQITKFEAKSVRFLCH